MNELSMIILAIGVCFIVVAAISAFKLRQKNAILKRKNMMLDQSQNL